MFPLRYTDFFLSPAWETPWKIFHRGRKHFADPAAGGDCFLAPMFSLRYIVAFDFFLSPNAYLPCRTFASGNSLLGRPVFFFFFPSPPMFPLRYTDFFKVQRGKSHGKFSIGEGNFLPTRRPAEIALWPRCLHPDTMPASIFF